MARQATSGQKKLVSKPAAKAPLRVTTPQKSMPTQRTLLDKFKAAKLDGMSDAQKVIVLMKEREILVGSLQLIETRLKTVEEREAKLIDRISWALDTINDLMRDQKA